MRAHCTIFLVGCVDRAAAVGGRIATGSSVVSGVIAAGGVIAGEGRASGRDRYRNEREHEPSSHPLILTRPWYGGASDGGADQEEAIAHQRRRLGRDERG